ncbi:hypothetical protein [Reyranella sp. CPCC 100927]|uniref:hypothetical protein n=1 Tax=Reyranella sp. CPCC 100927 TaxID=2599616 RepID=UPI0011B85CDF|nr:hypothetical protein [Reyranella sp. CPCC 100927]TWT06140.1 hypothetical protein FQU96_24160 [Reyranella sp. CPCC 100927]
MQLTNPLPRNIKVDVSYYSEAERQKLLRFPTAAAIEQVVAQPLEIPTAEFLTYYLFHRKKLGIEAYANYAAIARRANTALSSLTDCIEFDETSIRTPIQVKAQLNEICEHVGEAVGLSVVSRIHTLTDADWLPIPQQYGARAKPTLDFQIAADEGLFVQVETKGSTVADNSARSSAVQQHSRNITVKKEKAGKDAYATSVRYGTIAVLDRRAKSLAKCWLLDPEPEVIPTDPRHFRLLARMRFLRDWISFISPQSQLASALATRVNDLGYLSDPFQLSGVPLLRGSGEPFSFPSIDSVGHTTFFLRKSRVTDGPAGGVVAQAYGDDLYFFGIQERLLVLAAEQSFDDVLGFRLEPDTLEKTVQCVFTPSRFNRLQLPSTVRALAREENGLVVLELRGHINYSRSGLVFGVLPLEKSA